MRLPSSLLLSSALLAPSPAGSRRACLLPPAGRAGTAQPEAARCWLLGPCPCSAPATGHGAASSALMQAEPPLPSSWERWGCPPGATWSLGCRACKDQHLRVAMMPAAQAAGRSRNLGQRKAPVPVRLEAALPIKRTCSRVAELPRRGGGAPRQATAPHKQEPGAFVFLAASKCTRRAGLSTHPSMHTQILRLARWFLLPEDLASHRPAVPPCYAVLLP
jgi:hypothetical protein